MDNVIRERLSTLKEPSYLVSFSDGGCLPEQGFLPDFESKIDRVGSIQSIYIPPHCQLVVDSQHGYQCVIRGPRELVHMDSEFVMWNSPENEGEQKIDWNIYESGLNNQSIKHMTFQRYKTWTRYVHDALSSSIDLGNFFGVTIEDQYKDRFFFDLCKEDDSCKCNCVDVYNELKNLYPRSYSSLYIHNMSNKCPRTNYYVPSTIKRGGIDIESECVENAGVLISNNEFHNDGKVNFRCGGVTRNKSYYVSKIQEKEESVMRLEKENAFNVWYIVVMVVGFILFVLLLVGFVRTHYKTEVVKPVMSICVQETYI